MRWRGRRQSTNIIDLRLAKINIFWVNDYFEEEVPNGIIIDTDGSSFIDNDDMTTIANIGIARLKGSNKDEITTGQKLEIINFLSRLEKSTDLTTLEIGPVTQDNIVLVQYLQSIINNQ